MMWGKVWHTNLYVLQRRPLPGRRAASASGAAEPGEEGAGPVETALPGRGETLHETEWRRQRRRWRSHEQNY